MNKFIELTVGDGRKILINTDAIRSVITYKDLTHISLSDQECDCIVLESYEDVKRLCQ